MLCFRKVAMAQVLGINLLQAILSMLCMFVVV